MYGWVGGIYGSRGEGVVSGWVNGWCDRSIARTCGATTTAAAPLCPYQGVEADAGIDGHDGGVFLFPL